MLRKTICGKLVLTLALPVLLSMVLFPAGLLFSQTGDEAGPNDDQADEQSAPLDDQTPLTVHQEAIHQRYRRFEETLRQTAEYLRQADPERSHLLYRVLNRGQENRVLEQMRGVYELLEKEQLGDAAEQQKHLIEQMSALLKLLQSEGRQNEIEREKERLNKLVADISRLMGQEKGIRSGTVRGKDLKKLQDQQKKVAEETGKLNQEIDDHDKEQSGDDSESSNEDKDDQNADGKQGNGKESDGKSGEESDSKEGEKSDSSESESGESQPGKSSPENSQSQPSQPGESQPGQSQPGESQPGESQPEQDQRTPGRDELEQARQAMERAIEALKKDQRDQAEGQQEESIAKLLKAKEKLEEILRQLREEEQELLLTSLEARFMKMWDKQSTVNEGTINIAKTDQAQWTSRHFASVRKLIEGQEEVISEADKALLVLQQEGSSVAFPESLQQLREDMLLVTGRLEEQKVGDLTQTIEQEILEALGEMIEALRKEIDRKQQEKQQQSQQGQQQGQGPPSNDLIEKLSELKMLKTMQIRINKRTTRVGDLIQEQPTPDPALVDQLQQLSERQSRIQSATYKLATGENRVSDQ